MNEDETNDETDDGHEHGNKSSRRPDSSAAGKNHGDDQCSECQKMNVSNILTNVTVTIKESLTSNATTENILMSPKLEPKLAG